MVIRGAAAAMAGMLGTAVGGTAPGPRPSPAAGTSGPPVRSRFGQSAAFTDPTTRQPSLLIHLHKGVFVAYDAVCPHEGCTVGYAPSQKLIICPCHGSEFNPANGHLVQGPAPHGLRKLTVADADGQLFVTG